MIQSHEHQREAVPWWTFAVVGSLLTGWLAPQYLEKLDANSQFEQLRLLTSELHWALWYLPGALAGGLVGWLCIRPVNAVLAWLFRGFNRVFDWLTAVYGWVIAKLLRLSVLVAAFLWRLAGLDRLDLSESTHRLHPAARSRPADRERSVARLSVA